MTEPVFESRRVSIAGSPLHYRQSRGLGASGCAECRAARPAAVPAWRGRRGVGAAIPHARFAAAMPVLVPDHPGFGQSPDPAWLDNIHDAAYAYLDFLEALDLRGVHLVGYLARRLARARDRDPRFEPARVADRRRRLRHPSGPDPDRRSVHVESRGARPQSGRRSCALAERILALPQTAEQQDVALRNHFTTAKLAWEPRFFDPHLEKWLHRLRLPTHVIWGAQDRLFPPEYGHRLASMIPAARWSVIEGCGHLPQVERPDELAALVQQLARAA